MSQGPVCPDASLLDPSSGLVKGWVDARSLTVAQFSPAELAALRPQSEYATDPTGKDIFPNNRIMSAIGFDPASRRLVVSGKEWKHTYELRIEPAHDLGPEFVASSCGLSSLG